MSNVLNPILELLDPRALAGKIDRPHDDALYSYRGPQGIPSSFQEFRDWLRQYYEYHYDTAIGAGYRPPEEVSAGSAMQAVESAFGNRGGIEGAFQTAVIGMEQGLHSSFVAIATFLRETHRKWYMRWVIDTYIDPLDFDKKVALVRSLQKTYPVPDGYAGKRPEELTSNHYALVMDLVQRMKSYIPAYYVSKS